MAGDEAGNRGYHHIAHEIRDGLRNGRLVPGALLPTERELTTHFGVSRTTIRRALQALVESGWAESRPNRGVVGRLGPVSPSRRLIAFIDHIETVHRYLYTALVNRFGEHGLHLVHVDSGGRGTEAALEACVAQGFAASVVWSKTGTPEVDRLEAVQRHMPIIAVDHSMRGVATDVIRNDVFDGARRAVRHLTRLGRRKIVVTGMIDSLDTTQERIGGYLAGLFESGLQPQARDFVFCHTSAMDESDTFLLRQRLQEAPPFDAALVLQDPYVPTVAETLTTLGCRIPEDVALVGMGNEIPADFGSAGLTSVSFNWDLVADQIVDRVLLRLQDPSAPVATATLPVRLVVRGSCGAPSTSWDDDPYQECRPGVSQGKATLHSYRATGTLVPS